MVLKETTKKRRNEKNTTWVSCEQFAIRSRSSLCNDVMLSYLIWRDRFRLLKCFVIRCFIFLNTAVHVRMRLQLTLKLNFSPLFRVAAPEFNMAFNFTTENVSRNGKPCKFLYSCFKWLEILMLSACLETDCKLMQFATRSKLFFTKIFTWLLGRTFLCQLKPVILTLGTDCIAFEESQLNDENFVICAAHVDC
jgi:hypothetical protein